MSALWPYSEGSQKTGQCAGSTVEVIKRGRDGARPRLFNLMKTTWFSVTDLPGSLLLAFTAAWITDYR